MNGKRMIPFNFQNPNKFGNEKTEVKKTLQPIPRKDSTLEAEAGEIAVVSDDTGLPTSFTIGGNRHSSGGTPLNLPANSFIFSRDNSMKIKDKDILAQFGMGNRTSGYTPAEIAKKYDINVFRKVLADKNSDKMQKDTAESMITNYNEKLAKLALVQESHKGFPNGIPLIAQPYLHTSGLNPAHLFQQQEEDSEDQEQPDAEYARFGLNTNSNPQWYRGNAMKLGGEPKYQFMKKGGEINNNLRNNKGMVEIQYAPPMERIKFKSDPFEFEVGGEVRRRVRVIAPDKKQFGGEGNRVTAPDNYTGTNYQKGGEPLSWEQRNALNKRNKIYSEATALAKQPFNVYSPQDNPEDYSETFAPQDPTLDQEFWQVSQKLAKLREQNNQYKSDVPYLNEEEYKQHLLDPYSIDKRNAQIAYFNQQRVPRPKPSVAKIESKVKEAVTYLEDLSPEEKKHLGL
jgi:hypothetical protein